MAHPLIALDNSVGAAYVGLLVAAVLYGVTNVQTFIYYQSYPDDPKYMRCFIAVLWVLDGFHFICLAHYHYYITVTHFGDYFAILQPVWSLCTELLIAAIADLLVRLYYTRRVWILSKGNWFLTIVAFVFTVTTLVSGVALAVIGYRSNIITQATSVKWLVYLGLGSAVVTDLWVASSLCYLLQKTRSGLEGSKSLINTVMLYAVGTGLLTSICAICALITFAALPGSYVFIGFHFVLSKLYLNALLAMLNSRKRGRDRSVSGQRSIGGLEAIRLPRIPGTSFRSGSTTVGKNQSESTDVLTLAPKTQENASITTTPANERYEQQSLASAV